jgi:hypothetical protein
VVVVVVGFASTLPFSIHASFGLTAVADLDVSACGLENDGVVSLVPDGQVNRSLIN